jgi:ArsR family transcriptional regulator, arsenate/arsenite/antimonite-responsive transcriptional repressor
MSKAEQEYFDAVARFASMHRALGNPVRLRLFVGALAPEHPIKMDSKRLQKDLAEFFHVAPSTISHHFRALEAAGLIRRRRAGQQVTITPCREALEECRDFAQTLLEKREIAFGPVPELPDDSTV